MDSNNIHPDLDWNAPFFIGWSKKQLSEAILLTERLEHAKVRDGFDLDAAIAENHQRHRA
jgi:hypothetical protein